MWLPITFMILDATSRFRYLDSVEHGLIENKLSASILLETREEE